jgi:hypothetical protein
VCSWKSSLPNDAALAENVPLALLSGGLHCKIKAHSHPVESPLSSEEVREQAVALSSFQLQSRVNH